MQKYILIAFSKDRPGIVADITQIIYENHCNLEDSAMANLAGEFALIFLFSPLSSNKDADLQEFFGRECRRLEREKGITAFVSSVGELPPQSRKEAIETATITAEGHDHAGIVYKISRFLAEKQINISSLNSTVKSSPESGGTIYSLVINVQFPITVGREEIEKGLRRLGDELLIDINFE